MPGQYAPRNRYYRGAKLSEAKFVELVGLFTGGAPASQISRIAGISLRSVNTILIKLRKRVYDDARLNPLIQLHGDYGRPSADNPFWLKYRACLYDCPTLKMPVYPKPSAKAVPRLWHPADFKEWCGHCGILAHRRHPFWRPLEVWSQVNQGLPEDTFAHHVIYIMLVGYSQVLFEIDWRKMILGVLATDPL